MELDSFVEERRREDNLPGVSLAVVEGGRVALSRAWGLAAGAAFHIGSLTKLVTAVAALRLRELVDLDEPVREPGITLRHLLSHTSGLRRGPYLTAPVPTEERLAGVLPVFPPGERFKYSNLGFALAAQVLVRAADRPWKELAREILSDGGPPVPGHQRDHYRSLVRPGDALRPPPPIAAPEGAGDLVATADDLARLLAALLGGGLLSPASLAEMATPYTPGYGLGLRVGRRFGRLCLHHDGGHAGFSALLRAFPDDGVAGVILCNRCSARAPLSEILDLALRPRLRVRPPEPERLGRFAGRYAGPGRRIEVVGDQGLTLRHAGEEIPLRRLGPDRFLQARGPLSEHLLRFTLDRDEPWECVTGPLRWAAEEEGLWPLLWDGLSRGHSCDPRLTGVYSHPAVGDVRIFPRHGRPFFSFFYGEEVPLQRVRGGRYRIDGGMLDGEPLLFHGDAIDAGFMRFERRAPRPEDLIP